MNFTTLRGLDEALYHQALDGHSSSFYPHISSFVKTCIMQPDPAYHSSTYSPAPNYASSSSSPQAYLSPTLSKNNYAPINTPSTSSSAVHSHIGMASASLLAPVQQPTSERKKLSGRYTLSDFSVERTLGTGSFGRVHLARSRYNGRFYAIKVLRKEQVVRMKQVEHTNSERAILEAVRHPFLVTLWGTFASPTFLFMVMDFVPGGELFSLLRRSQRFPAPVAKFYAAEVALAIDYLHRNGFIYRDLKPENILLSADGHLKITDFGFAKYVPDVTWTLCGEYVPVYWIFFSHLTQARRTIWHQKLCRPRDTTRVLTGGLLVFCCLRCWLGTWCECANVKSSSSIVRHPPFFTEDGNPIKLYEKIIACKVRYPPYFEPLAKDLLKRLLTADLTKRIGNLLDGSKDIFGHLWFAEVDWDRLYRKEIPAPYIPPLSTNEDSSL